MKSSDDLTPKDKAEFLWGIRGACLVGIVVIAVPQPWNLIILVVVSIAARFGIRHYEKLEEEMQSQPLQNTK